MTAPYSVLFTPDGPQPLIREIPPGEPFPVETLGELRNAVKAVQGMTQAPMAIPAASALSLASLAVQAFADVETLGGPRPLSLYMLTIARSGERKSSCDAPLMEALRDHEREEAAQRLDEYAKWQNAHALWKGDRDKILSDAKRAKGVKRTEAEVDLDALGPEPEPPVSPDRTVTEPTFEGLTRLYATGMPSLGIFSDEGGQFLGGHAMNSDNRQKSLAALNDLWQGNPIRRTRAGDGHSTLHERRLAIHLMVQPAAARSFMADPLTRDIGFLPRFLICEPESTIGTRFHANRRQDYTALAAFSQRLRNILEKPMPMDDQTRDLQPRLLSLSEAARALLTTFADDLEFHQAAGRDLANVTAYASRVAEQAARLAGVLTLWGDLEAKEVAADTMAGAITLARFYLGEAVRLGDAATVSAETNRAEALRRWLAEDWGKPEFVLRDVMRLGPNSLRESSKIKAAIRILEAHGWIVKLPEGVTVEGVARKESWRVVTNTQ